MIKVNADSHECWFDNGSWVKIEKNDDEWFWEYQSDSSDEDTYICGTLLVEGEESGTLVVTDYDGCFELPEVVEIAGKELYNMSFDL